MKRLVIFALIGGLGLFSCRTEEEPIPGPQFFNSCIKVSSVVLNGEGEVLRSKTYQYNENRLLINEISKDEDGNRTDSTHYIYNSKGRLLAKQTTSFVGGLDLGETWTYYPDGRIEKHTEWTDQIAIRSTTNFYNSNGDLDSVYQETKQSDGWILYNYNSENKIQNITTYQGDGSIYSTQEFIYEDTLTTQLVKFPSGTLWMYFEIVSDVKGREIERRKYDSNGVFMNSVKTKYDQDGNVVALVTEHSSGSVLETHTIWNCI